MASIIKRAARIVAWAAIMAASAMAFLVALYAFAPPVSTLMIGRWATLQPVERVWVPMDRIAPALPAAVVMAEDAQFCRHSGVDWTALHEVVSAEGGPARGASTITMQVAKNLFLWPSRSFVRKAMEIPIALLIDLAWSKRRIMEVYLNIAEWGAGVFGAEAAARKHFGKSASQLTAGEAALLARALPNPVKRAAGKPTRRHQALARLLQTRMGGAAPWLDCLR